MPERPRIVVNKSSPRAVEMFSTIGEVLALDSSEFTADTFRDAEILIVRSETRVDRKLLEGSPLRFVGTVTIGTDHLDVDYLQSKGIPFVSAPGSNARSVAEYVCAGLLEILAADIRGKTLGIIGVGHVGSLVAEMAKALGMRVLLNDPPRARTTREPEFLPLDDLMNADVISLHVPLTRTGQDATYHLFDDSRIKKMKRGALLVNTSRGAVVVTDALREALTAKHLSGAMLDVWEGEPTIDIDLLHRGTLATAHIAGYSLDGRLRAVEMVFDEVCRFLGVPAGKSSTGENLHIQDVILPRELTAKEDIVRFAIRAAYDIRADDQMLRRVAKRSHDERASYFSRLRSEYRTRYEFKHWNIKITRAQSHATQTLRDLGFAVEEIP